MVDVCSTLGFPGDSVVKNLPVNAGDLGSIPGLGRCLPAKRRKWQSTPVGCLKNSMDRGAWWAIVHGIAMSWTQLSDERTTTKASSSFSLVCKQSISYSRVGGISYSFLLLSTTKSLPDRWCPWDIGWINEHLMCSLLVIFLEFPAWSNTPSSRHALLVRVPMLVPCVTLTTSCCGGEILTQPGVPGRGSICTETEADNFQKPYCRVQYPPVKYFKTGFEKKARTLVSFGLYHCGEAYSQSIFMQK